MQVNPQISVITVVFNGAQHLEQCMQSVLAQEGVSLEYIVIDGGSTDGSKQIIESYAPQLHYWISESDTGIAQAMNKGIRQARGERLLFLQSDDYLVDKNVLARAASLLRPVDLLGCFSIDVLSDAGLMRRRHPKGFVWWLNFKNTFTHQGTLFHRDLFSRFGLYDESFRVDMDYEYYIRLFRAGTRAALYTELCLAVMRGTGLSSRRDWSHLRERFREERAVHRRHTPSAIYAFAYRIYWPLYLCYRRIRSAINS